jgi:hypothetical protein
MSSSLSQVPLAGGRVWEKSFFCFWQDWGLNSGLYTYKAGELQLELHRQSILFWLFWRWGWVGESHELLLQAGLEL